MRKRDAVWQETELAITAGRHAASALQERADSLASARDLHTEAWRIANENIEQKYLKQIQDLVDRCGTL